MPDPELIETANRLEIRSPMRVGMRVVFAVLALFPLIAPSELIIRTEWEYYLHPIFFLAAFISAGAVALSGFFIFGAFAGLSSRMVFDGTAGTFTYTEEAPVVRRSTRVHSLADIRSVEVGVRDWSDSSPTYHVHVSMADGTVYESGASWTRDEVESIRSRVEEFLARPRVAQVKIAGTGEGSPDDTGR